MDNKVPPTLLNPLKDMLMRLNWSTYEFWNVNNV